MRPRSTIGRLAGLGPLLTLLASLSKSALPARPPKSIDRSIDWSIKPLYADSAPSNQPATAYAHAWIRPSQPPPPSAGLHQPLRAVLNGGGAAAAGGVSGGSSGSGTGRGRKREAVVDPSAAAAGGGGAPSPGIPSFAAAAAIGSVDRQLSPRQAYAGDGSDGDPSGQPRPRNGGGGGGGGGGGEQQQQYPRKQQPRQPRGGGGGGNNNNNNNNDRPRRPPPPGGRTYNNNNHHNNHGGGAGNNNGGGERRQQGLPGGGWLSVAHHKGEGARERQITSQLKNAGNAGGLPALLGEAAECLRELNAVHCTMIINR